MERRGAARGGRSTLILRSLVVRQKGRRFYNEIKICSTYAFRSYPPTGGY